MKARGVIATVEVMTIIGCAVHEASETRLGFEPKAPSSEVSKVKTENLLSTAQTPAEVTGDASAVPMADVLEEQARPCVGAKKEAKAVPAMKMAHREAPLPAEAIGHLKCERAVAPATPAPCVTLARQPAQVGYVVRDFNTELYDLIVENSFKKVLDEPLSTFSIDVDKASYGNIRRFLTANTLPPADAVRIEEMVNYFTYNYPAPGGGEPFSITTEAGGCPWNIEHRLVLIGLQGKKVAEETMPPGNLVFLLDVSGSMDSPDKLPLIKAAMKMLVNRLRPQDRVAIVVYAGSAGLVLQSTSGDRKDVINGAIDRLSAGGSTAGGEGIELAYATAKNAYIVNGNNRVILATDGDFNVGASSDGDLVRMIEAKRRQGIYLTVLGVGTGNYKDSKMEQLADKGNGNYAYLDNLQEAKKVLVSEMGGTLLTIAKDVKIQVEFNPEQVAAYRLIGYENRSLADRDFNDDTKDAGELGSGHTVTALYEIIPAGLPDGVPSTDPLKYQTRHVKGNGEAGDELLTVKFRYKRPDEEQSRKIEKVVHASASEAVSDNFTFAAAVAGFGMLLRNSESKGDLTYQRVIGMARRAQGRDAEGYRAECVGLMERAAMLASKLSYRDE